MVERTNFLDYAGLCKLVEEMNNKYATKDESLIIDGVTLITNADGKTETRYKAQKVGYEEYLDLVAAGQCDEYTFYYIDEAEGTPTIKIGSTDISNIGDGTITGAIKSLYNLYSLDKELSRTSAKAVENRAIANHFENYYQKDETPVKLAMTFNADHELTIQLQNSRGDILSTQTKNLMIESVVVGGHFNEETGILVLELNEGDPIEIPISSLVSGLVNSDTRIAGIDLQDDITSQELTLALNIATTSSQGMLSSVDKIKLDRLDVETIEDAIDNVNSFQAISNTKIKALFEG